MANTFHYRKAYVINVLLLIWGITVCLYGLYSAFVVRHNEGIGYIVGGVIICVMFNKKLKELEANKSKYLESSTEKINSPSELLFTVLIVLVIGAFIVNGQLGKNWGNDPQTVDNPNMFWTDFKYSDPALGFAVTFPAEPQRFEENQFDSSLEHNTKITSFFAEEDKIGYLLIIRDFQDKKVSSKNPDFDPKVMMEELLDKFVKSSGSETVKPGGEIIEKEELLVNDSPALRWKVKKETEEGIPTTTEGLFVFNEGKLYFAYAVYSHPPTGVKKFLDSFQLL